MVGRAITTNNHNMDLEPDSQTAADRLTGRAVQLSLVA